MKLLLKNALWWHRHCRNPWWHTLEVLGFCHGRRVTFHFRNGLRFTAVLGHYDTSAISEIWANDEYRLKEFENPHLVLDLGAHKGAFALHAARRYPGAMIVCVEPLPANAALLEWNVQQNGLQDRITIAQAAVSNKNGTARLDTSGKDAGGKIARTGITVKTIDINAFLDLKPDLVKVDIEGGEYRILNSKTLPRIPSLVMEWHDDTPVKEQRLRRDLRRAYPEITQIDRMISATQRKQP
jgi:FkbM family methyltransferase